MTDAPQPVRIADLKPGDRFTFGPPANVVYAFIESRRDKFRFSNPTGSPGVTYAAPILGAKVWRV